MQLGPLLTFASYIALTILWGTCFVVYVHRRNSAISDALVRVLVGALALDAFKNVFESLYFGTLWGSRFGYLPATLGAPLEQGWVMAIPKILNVSVATLILVRVAAGFLPRELRRRERQDQEAARLQRELEDSLAIIKESEGRLQSMLERTTDMVVFWRVVDDDLVLESLNASSRATLGFGDEAIGSSARELAPPAFLAMLLAACQSKVAQRVEDGFLDTPQGRRAVIRQVVPLPDPDGVVRRVVSFTHDITALRDRQADEETRTRLESLGILAGGVAHDFNNLLTVLRADVAQAQEGDAAEVALVHANTTIDRARDLVLQLLAMAGKRAPVTAAVDFGAVVMDTVRLLRPGIPQQITVEANIEDGDAIVVGDRAQLQQIALNLLQNAVDATVAHTGDQGGSVRLSVTVSADECVLRVQDDGAGIDPAVLRRVFEPFFTTKASGRGLGLATVFGLTQAHGGHVEVLSPPGEGACFQVRLPRTHSSGSRPKARLTTDAADVSSDHVDEAPAGRLTTRTPDGPIKTEALAEVAAEAAAEGRAPPVAEARTVPLNPGEKMRILVIDDDPMVRRATRRQLERLGHTVLEAGDGESGIDVDPSSYDFAVVDVTMPGLDGPTTLARLRARRPGLPAVIVTGRGDLVDDSHEVLLKPFDRELLAAAIVRALERV